MSRSTARAADEEQRKQDLVRRQELSEAGRVAERSILWSDWTEEPRRGTGTMLRKKAGLSRKTTKQRRTLRWLLARLQTTRKKRSPSSALNGDTGLQSRQRGREAQPARPATVGGGVRQSAPDQPFVQEQRYARKAPGGSDGVGGCGGGGLGGTLQSGPDHPSVHSQRKKNVAEFAAPLAGSKISELEV